jgi:glycosidase
MDDFTRFTDSAHARGMHIMVDCILNHVSDQHPWFQEARTSRTSPYHNYFVWSHTGTEMQNAEQPFHDIKPSNWVHDSLSGDFYYATFYPQQPDLNWHEPRVFEEMSAIMEYWIEAGVDAFRLDAAPHLIEVEGTRSHGEPATHALLKRLRAHLATQHPHVALLAEAFDTYDSASQYFGEGDESHMVYDFPLASDLIANVRHAPPTDISTYRAKSPTPPHGCAWVRFLRNHDELALDHLDKKVRETLLYELDPDRHYRFHGDHALSLRLADIFADTPEKIRSAYTTLFSLPGVPHLYYGDEIGMKNDLTIGTPKDTRRYVRGQFDWAEAERQMADPDSLFNFVAGLARRRTESHE